MVIALALAVAVVKDGTVVSAKGYGVKTVGQSAMVDDKSLFGIASNTKVFTAAALGSLVDEGKLQWDAPVIQYLPGFRLSDPYVTSQMTIRDLLVHRSGLGLGADDLLVAGVELHPPRDRRASREDSPRHQLPQRVRVRQRAVSRGRRNHRSDHRPELGRLHFESSAQAHRHDVKRRPPFGRDGRRQRGRAARVRQRRSADGHALRQRQHQPGRRHHVKRHGHPPLELKALKKNFSGYALGLGVSDYRGKKLITHTGGLPGYASRIAWIPELNVGVAALTNQESSEAWNSVAWSVLDHYLGANDTDWVAAFSKVKARVDAALAKADADTSSSRNSASKPSLPLEKFAGIYNDAWYGDVTVAVESGKLVVRFTKTPLLVGDAEHWQYDTFLVKWRDRELRADAFITFSLDADGRIDVAKMRAASPSVDFSFDFQDLLLRKVH